MVCCSRGIHFSVHAEIVRCKFPTDFHNIVHKDGPVESKRSQTENNGLYSLLTEWTKNSGCHSFEHEFEYKGQTNGK